MPLTTEDIQSLTEIIDRGSVRKRRVRKFLKLNLAVLVANQKIEKLKAEIVAVTCMMTGGELGNANRVLGQIAAERLLRQ